MKINHKKKNQKKRKKFKLKRKIYQNKKRKLVIKIRKGNPRRMSQNTNRVKQRKKSLVSL